MSRLCPILAIALIALAGCRDDAPPWLAQLQAHMAAAPVTNPPSQIVAFEFDGRTVFYRPPYCCDVQGVLYGADGTVLCHPDGGITGDGDGRCPRFFAERRDCRVVWADPRGKAAPDACAAATPRRERSER